MRKEVVIALLCFLLLGLSGCAGSRTTTKEKRTAESQLREATVENKQAEKREATTVETNTERSEKRNIIIEFTKIEYYSEDRKRPNRFIGQFQKADSTFNEEVRKALEEMNEETAVKNTGQTKGNIKGNLRLNDKSKPPNIKSETSGRIVINGDTQETSDIKAAANKDETTTEAIITTTEEATKATSQTKEKKYPKISPFLWVLIGCGLAAVFAGVFYIHNKIVKK